MVAEVELEAVAKALVGSKRGDLRASLLQAGDVGARQALAAHLVVKHVHAHTGAGSLHKDIAGAVTQAVVVDHVKMEQDVVCCLSDSRKDAVEGRFPVNQQFHLVAMR